MKKLLKGNDLTNACVLLFGKNPQDFFIQAGIKCIRFKGTDITADMLDFKDIEGDLFQQVEETENFIFRNISLRAWLNLWEGIFPCQFNFLKILFTWWYSQDD